jgi:hypothetical protein
MTKEYDELENIDFVTILDELRTKMPFLLDVMMIISMSESQLISATCIRSISPRLATCYGILMQHSFHELSLLQRLTSSLLLESIAEQKVYSIR